MFQHESRPMTYRPLQVLPIGVPEGVICIQHPGGDRITLEVAANQHYTATSIICTDTCPLTTRTQCKNLYGHGRTPLLPQKGNGKGRKR